MAIHPDDLVALPPVLIVEDNHDLASFMDLLLRTAGYQTLIAHNGREALARMHEQKPCVVLLDLAMPVMDGFEFRVRQLAEPALADVPVVCVTAHYRPSQVVATLGLRCLSKPVDVDEVERVVAEICGSGSVPPGEVSHPRG